MKLRHILFSLFLAAAASLPAQWQQGYYGAAGVHMLPTEDFPDVTYGQIGMRHSRPYEVLSGSFEFGVECAKTRLHAGIGIVVAPKRFDLIVRRYAVYHSPGGNQYGGYAENTCAGYFSSMGLSLHGDYFFVQRTHLGLGWSFAGKAHRFHYLNFRLDDADKTQGRSVSEYYCSLLSGPVLSWKYKAYTVELKPLAQRVVAQKHPLFYEWGYWATVGVVYYPFNE